MAVRRVQIGLGAVLAAALLVWGATAFLDRSQSPTRRGSMGGTTEVLTRGGGFVVGHRTDNPDRKPVTVLEVRADTSPNVTFAGDRKSVV